MLPFFLFWVAVCTVLDNISAASFNVMINKGRWNCKKWTYDTSRRSYSVCFDNPCILEGNIIIPVMSGADDHYFLNLFLYVTQCNYNTNGDENLLLCKQFLEFKVDINLTSCDGIEQFNGYENTRNIPISPYRITKNVNVSIPLKISSQLPPQPSGGQQQCYYARLIFNLKAKYNKFCGILNNVTIISPFCPQLTIGFVQYPKYLTDLFLHAANRFKI